MLGKEYLGICKHVKLNNNNYSISGWNFNKNKRCWALQLNDIGINFYFYEVSK